MGRSLGVGLGSGDGTCDDGGRGIAIGESLGMGRGAGEGFVEGSCRGAAIDAGVGKGGGRRRRSLRRTGRRRWCRKQLSHERPTSRAPLE